jgi:uncharacterized phiE125 gp8 family phage protein
MAEFSTAKVNTLSPADSPAAPVAVGEIDATKLLPEEAPQMRLMARLDEPVQVAEPITLQQAKDHLHEVYDDNDDLILGLIVAARQMAEGKLNRTITQRTVEAGFSSWDSMVLRKPPVITIDSVVYIDEDGAEQTLQGFVLRNRGHVARVALPVGFTAPTLAKQDESIVVRYTAGYPPGEVPQPIIQWMKLQIGTMYLQREGIAVGVSVASVPEEVTHWMLHPYMVYE